MRTKIALFLFFFLIVTFWMGNHKSPVVSVNDQHEYFKPNSLRALHQKQYKDESVHSSLLINNMKKLLKELPFNEQGKDLVITYCKKRTAECKQIIKHELEKLVDWSLEKAMLFVDSTLELRVLQIDLMKSGLTRTVAISSDEHLETQYLRYSILKAYLIDQLALKIDNYEVDPQLRDQFMNVLKRIAKNDKNLMLVRRALVVLRNTYNLDQALLTTLVAKRQTVDLVAYHDILL